MISCKRTNSDDADFKSLVALLDAYLAEIDGDEHAFYAQYNKTGNLRHVIVCYLDDKAAGCGAIREFEEDKVEVKRMYVLPAFRSKGIGLTILKELESWAAELQYSGTVLETGKRQQEAIALYQKAGYEIIPSYGQYKNVENSVCMSKIL